MKLYTYQTSAQSPDEIGVGYTEQPGKIWPLSCWGMAFADMNALIRSASPEQLAALRVPPEGTASLRLDSLVPRAPIPFPLQDVLCLGINYYDHLTEAGRFDRAAFGDRPRTIYFSKRVSEANWNGGVIPAYETLVDSLDYECELGVVIGRDAWQVRAEDAFDYVFGYTILNDVSARNLQTGHKQWYFGKSLDGHTPMGPCILTADEVASPPALGIRCRVNGETRQDSNTEYLMTGIAEIIAELTQGMTLKAGTIIATGTPAGVGMGMQPPCFLKKGDVVECEIGGIGTLANVIG